MLARTAPGSPPRVASRPMSPVAPEQALIAPGEGETITDKEHRHVAILAERDELTITRSRYGPGERGPDPHVHRDHTDAFYTPSTKPVIQTLAFSTSTRPTAASPSTCAMCAMARRHPSTASTRLATVAFPRARRRSPAQARASTW